MIKNKIVISKIKWEPTYNMKYSELFRKQFKKMKWYVWMFDGTTNKLEKRNIFDCNIVFNTQIYRLLTNKRKIEESFEEELRIILMSEFWSRCQYEYIINDDKWESDPKHEHKVDVYSQIRLNWTHFVKYVKRFRQKKKSHKKNSKD